MKKILLFITVLCTSCSLSSPFDNEFRNTHIVYEGIIEAYSNGPYDYQKKEKQEIVMELWFPKEDFVYGYWKKKGEFGKHYLRGFFWNYRPLHKKDINRRENDNSRFSGLFYEMKKYKNYRLSLSEYKDECFSDPGDKSFYIYNFEEGKLQGSYYASSVYTLTDGKKSWRTAFSTTVDLRRTN